MQTPAPLPALTGALLSAFVAGGVLTGNLLAQTRIGGHVIAPMPPQAIPVTAPPVDHPVYGNQPLMPRSDDDKAAPAAPAPAGPNGPAVQPDPAEKLAQEFLAKRVQGQDLKKAIERVLALDWKEKLSDAKAAAASSGKPILWIQALGDIDGFA